MIRLKGRKTIKEGWRAASLMIDANFQLEAAQSQESAELQGRRSRNMVVGSRMPVGGLTLPPVYITLLIRYPPVCHGKPPRVTVACGQPPAFGNVG
jgi:hypothetical protein